MDLLKLPTMEASAENNELGEQGFVANGASLAISSPLGEGDYSAGFNVGLLLGGRADVFGGGQ